ncbi:MULTISPECIES: response regulator transcription factor [Aquimarina]|uniref:Response regulator transcription factor n=1 Tax=Aquimarina algiphila TaxID=2047982 RepID=A0A554VH24_9FLAO|nr:MULTISPECIES: response regulator transcription factor [Aquimarina]TSE06743.1 response regulator transcription factor [Aquimarina algiphila]
MKYNLIIADDHSMFLDGLLSIFNEHEKYTILFTAKNGENIIKYLDINPPKSVDLVISDLSMPSMDGITLNKLIKEKHPEVKTLIVSMHADVSKIGTLINDHVDGYIPKNAKKEELLTAIDTILNGSSFFSDTIKNIYQDFLFNSNKIKEKQVMLTPREKEVLKLIAKEHTSQEIADILMLSKYTIESYRKTLLGKLGVRNIAGLTRYAIESGLT